MDQQKEQRKVFSAHDNMNKLFGDPTPGKPKRLQIEYDIENTKSVIVVNENKGCLTKDIYLELSTGLTITRAFWGNETRSFDITDSVSSRFDQRFVSS
jgi:hypothetical protein